MCARPNRRPVATQIYRMALLGESCMATGDSYLAMALELLARADGETDEHKREGFRTLAAHYRRMAGLARYREGDEGKIERAEPKSRSG